MFSLFFLPPFKLHKTEQISSTLVRYTRIVLRRDEEIPFLVSSYEVQPTGKKAPNTTNQ